MSAEPSPKIVIVDESPIRAAILQEGLREAGYTGVVHISEMQNLLARIYALDPEVIVIDPGFGRCRGVGLYRRRIEERTSQADPRPLYLAIQCVREAAGRTRSGQI